MRQRESPQSIGRQPIHSGLIETKSPDGMSATLRQEVVDNPQIFFIVRRIFQFHIDLALTCLRKGKLARQCTEVVSTSSSSCKDLRRPIALVHIEIDHCCPLHQSLAPQPKNRDGNIVEHAESRAFAAKCVVRPARQSSRPGCGRAPSFPEGEGG